MRYLADNFTQGLQWKQAAIDHALASHVEGVRRSLDVLGRLEKFEHAIVNNPEEVENTLKVYHLRTAILSLIRNINRPVSQEPPEYEASEEIMALFAQVLIDAKVSVEAWGGRFVFVYLPEWERYNNMALANRNREAVLRLVDHLGIPMVDIVPAFAAQTNPLSLFPFGLNGHYNFEGNRVVAEEVLGFLNRNSPSLRLSANEG
jgi:hypothetical protein